MYGFWGGRFEKAFIDVRVFNPSAQSNRHGSLSAIYRKHEQEKKSSGGGGGGSKVSTEPPPSG